MGFISIDKFIDYVKNNNVPCKYYRSRHHKKYIDSLSLEDYGKWEEYLHNKKNELKRKWRRENREIFYKKYHGNKKFREHRLEQYKEWYRNNKEKVYAGLRRRYWKKKLEQKGEEMRTINVLKKEGFVVIKQGCDQIIIEKSNVELINDLIRQLEEVKKEQK